MPDVVSAPDAEVLPADGRRARRERGRQAVLDAMLDLVGEGAVPPSTEVLARRAGVSSASIFRYFENLDELRELTLARFFERYADLFEVPGLGEGGLDDRIDRFVAARLGLYAVVAPVARLARSRVQDQPRLAEQLTLVRRRQAEQVHRHFGGELAALAPATAEDRVALVAALTAFETWDHLIGDLGLEAADVERAWRDAVGLLLAP